ncbi:MAG: tRNA (guanine(10)-N(2))-dimethyltransferase [Thermoplasmata archaeon]|nr:MAG: tRNA (guanine(10)-N(2))-dimethyltransferase [Thermoplasmata archaeon]RLF36093.1 MAG: tRNA (guanine(10)-N(2))-dimethyltransferase [Thermoplasmata archaeon]
MTKTQDNEIIQEGKTEILVHKTKVSRKGPGTKDKKPFYNPAMELNRDISVLMSQWFIDLTRRHVYILDGLAASGINGIRLANEVKGNFTVIINDWNKNAFFLIKKNIEYNRLKNAFASNEELNILLSKNRYEYIDIDPFGSPAYFVDSAVRSITNNGLIACTATDTAALCGVYPKTCIRRYGAKPLHSHVMHEVGLRILIGFICREAAKYDKGIEPMLCYYRDHYFRVYLKIKRGVRYANRSISKISCVDPKKTSFTFSYKKFQGNNIGPLWIGRLHDKDIIKKLRDYLSEKDLNTRKTIWKLLDLFEEEADGPIFFHTTEHIASKLKISPPSMEKIFEKLCENGYNVRRTHFSPTGFKTDASLDEIEEIFKRINRETKRGR